MIVSLKDPLIQRWRTQVGGQLRRRAVVGLRSVAALLLRLKRPPAGELARLADLQLFVLHDEVAEGELRIRFAGYSAGVIAGGVAFGGVEQTLLEKNLSLPPSRSRNGDRFLLGGDELLQAALSLDRRLSVIGHRPHWPRRRVPVLPQLWAQVDDPNPSAQGPEAEAFCERFNFACGALLSQCSREHHGARYFPLEFVSHLRFRAVHVETATIRKIQVCDYRMPADLIGFQDAAMFDLFHSRFRSAAPE